MLDLELITTSGDGLDIVTLPEMKAHIRLASANTSRDADIQAAVRDAAAALHGRTGTLNRTIFPTTWVRYLKGFPRCRVVQLPYPPLIEVLSITYEQYEAGSPSPLAVDTAGYIVRTGGIVGEVEFISTPSVPWVAPTTTRHPRAVAITFNAGYTEYPPQLKRAVKMLAAHYLENPEATITDRASAMSNRKVEFGLDSLINSLRVPVAYDGWN